MKGEGIVSGSLKSNFEKVWGGLSPPMLKMISHSRPQKKTGEKYCKNKI